MNIKHNKYREKVSDFSSFIKEQKLKSFTAKVAKSALSAEKRWAFRLMVVMLMVFFIFSGGAFISAQSAPGSISVDCFGAIGNGTTDDTKAIQNCINANPGKPIIFTNGKNYSADNLTVPAGAIVSGYGAKVTARSNLNNIFIMINNSQLLGLEIIGQNSVINPKFIEDTTSYGNGVFGHDISGAIVKDCNIHNIFDMGVFFYQCNNCQITNNQIRTTGFDGIQLRYGDGCIINKNMITVDIGPHGIQFWGYDFSNAANKKVTNLTVDSNTVTKTGNVFGANIWGTVGNNIHFTNNICKVNDGISCDYNMGMEASSNSDFTGNHVYNGSEANIAVFYPNEFGANGACQNIKVQNNDLHYDSGASVANGVVACIRSWGTNINTTIIGNTFDIQKSGIPQTSGF